MSPLGKICALFVLATLAGARNTRFAKSRSSGHIPHVMVDFTDATNAGANVNDWFEVSDTIPWTNGMSKATIVEQKTKVYRRAVFFSTLIPQPSGAAFAGVKHNLAAPLDITGHDIISIKGRARGDNDKVKFHLRDGTLDANNEGGYYKANFTVNLSNPGLVEYQIQVSDLVYEKSGYDNTTFRAIDLSDITQIGFQTFGGVFDNSQQHGALAFEIESIVAED